MTGVIFGFVAGLVVAGLLIYVLSAKKHREYREYHQVLLSVVHTFAEAIDRQSTFSGHHTMRVKNLCKAIGRELGVPQEDIQRLELAAMLHNVGNVGISTDVLNKEGALTGDEYDAIKKHTVFGNDIVMSAEKLDMILPGIRSHHERYDGSGYPDGAAGEEIDILARIIAVADAYDAMISDRPYRKRHDADFAVEELRKNAGTQFDPKVVDAFMKVYRAKHDKAVEASGI